MKLTLTRIAPLRAALITAVVYGCLSLVFVPFLLLSTFFAQDGMAAVAGVVMAIAFPIGYSLMGFILTLFMCGLYNFLVKYTGGVKMEFAGDEAQGGASEEHASFSRESRQ